MTCGEAVENLLEFCLSFGPPKVGWRVLMKKNGETAERENSTVKCWETPFERDGRRL